MEKKKERKGGSKKKNPERRLWIKSNQTISSTHTLGRGKEEDEGKAWLDGGTDLTIRSKIRQTLEEKPLWFILRQKRNLFLSKAPGMKFQNWRLISPFPSVVCAGERETKTLLLIINSESDSGKRRRRRRRERRWQRGISHLPPPSFLIFSMPE